MRVIITIDVDDVLEDMRYSKTPAEGISVTAMHDEDGAKYIEIIIGRDHPLFNFKLIHDTVNAYYHNMFKGVDEVEQVFVDLEHIIFKLI